MTNKNFFSTLSEHLDAYTIELFGVSAALHGFNSDNSIAIALGIVTYTAGKLRSTSVTESKIQKNYLAQEAKIQKLESKIEQIQIQQGTRLPNGQEVYGDEL